MSYILSPEDSNVEFEKQGGGKAANLARLAQFKVEVPEWFCLRSTAFTKFIEYHQLEARLKPTSDLKAFELEIANLFDSLSLPPEVSKELLAAVKWKGFENDFLAVRSSGLDEDSADCSFAGQFSSFLFQKGTKALEKSVKGCWASGFSERGLSYRLKNHLSIEDIGVAVVIQRMIDTESAGVAFSRNPVRLTDRDHVIVSSVWGLGEGLVSGQLDADLFTVERSTLEFQTQLADKNEAFHQGTSGGVSKVSLQNGLGEKPSLTPLQVKEVAQLVCTLEDKLGTPQDCEWGFCNGKLYCFQTRPITNVPPLAYYKRTINGINATLWDNSNIIESYSGVTSPLTFTFASNAYRQVYLQFCEVIGVPQNLIDSYQSVFRNMLGSVRGRVYYNLINWYKLVVLLPGTTNNKGFMETMMGVRDGLDPEAAKLFDFADQAPKFSLGHKLKLSWLTYYRFLTIDKIVHKFQSHFDGIYNKARSTDFSKLSLRELADYYHYLDKEILHRWQAPIINDCLCMVFFGFLKKLCEKWVVTESSSSLQNDLLCGQGDLESTEPTKMLMRIAEKIDTGERTFRQWILEAPSDDVWKAFKEGKAPDTIIENFNKFLDKYGFRCVNELKLEENDLHDDPSFAINALVSYVRMKTYSIADMEKREKAIRIKSEQLVINSISGWRRRVFFWVLKHARKAIRNRENLRFDRTKIFGVVRHLFRAMGGHFVALQVLNNSQDVFYLTLDEILAFIEGRSFSLSLKELVERRRQEYDVYRQSTPPPDRFVTYGTVGVSLTDAQLLMSGDLTQKSDLISDDPSILLGTPCCPGIIEGIVRVVINITDAEGLNGEILVTERTDPGWVPLYPSCSGLLIERGSLLSHSAVVARELGLPTIVGIAGGLMQKLKTGQRVRIDAGKGEVRIL